MSNVPNTLSTMNLSDVYVCDIGQANVSPYNTFHAPDLPCKSPASLLLNDAEEQEIVVQYCNGTSICEIAKQLYFPVATIRSYLQQAGLLTTLDGNHEIPGVIVKSLG